MIKQSFIKNRIYWIFSVTNGLLVTLALFLDNLLIFGKLNEYGIYGVIGFILVCLLSFLFVFGISYFICFIIFRIKLNYHSKKGNEIMSQKAIKVTYYFIPIILTICIGLAIAYIVTKKGTLSFFLPGFSLSTLTSILLIMVLESHKKEKFNNKGNFQILKFIYYIASLVSTVLLIASIIGVYYTLTYGIFPQAIGKDQTAYWMACAPLVYLSYLEISINYFSWLLLFSLPKHGNN